MGNVLDIGSSNKKQKNSGIPDFVQGILEVPDFSGKIFWRFSDDDDDDKEIAKSFTKEMLGIVDVKVISEMLDDGKKIF